MEQRRPAGITLVAVWFIIGGLFHASDGVVLSFLLRDFFGLLRLGTQLFRGPNFQLIQTVFTLVGILHFITGIAMLALAWGLLEGREWARTWGIVAAAIAGGLSLLLVATLILIGGGRVTFFAVAFLLPAGVDVLALAYLFSHEAQMYCASYLETSGTSEGRFSLRSTQVSTSWQTDLQSGAGIATPGPTGVPDTWGQPVSPPPHVQPSPAKTELVHPPGEARGWLVITSGVHRGRRFVLGMETMVGRDPSACQIVLSDPTVSRQHAKVRLEGRRFYVYDLGSTAGTYVNGHRVQREQLMDNDRIRLGQTELIVKLADVGGA